MRLALISDLHGNLVALDAVLADIDRRGIDRIVCLGDIVDLGPQPLEVVHRLRARGIPCVRGNHDPLDEHPPAPRLREIETWTAQQLPTPVRTWLDDLPTSLTVDLDGARVLCVHGSPRQATDQLLDDTPRGTLDAWCDGHDFDALVAGHTHVQMVRRLDHRLLVNVGSVGMPFLRPLGAPPPKVLPWCDYAVLEGHAGRVEATLCRLPLDLPGFAASLRASTLPDAEQWLAQWGSVPP
jgi:putative phosphoesterase